MTSLLRLSRAIDAINQRLGQLSAWAIVLAIFIATANAISRRFLNISSNAWLEAQWYLFGAVVMLCAAWAMRDDSHVRIDIMASRLSPRSQNWLELFGLIAFVLPLVALMSWLLVGYVRTSIALHEVSLNPGGLAIWPVKAVLLVGFVSLLAQTLSQIIKRVASILGHVEDTTGHVSQVDSGDESKPGTSP